MRRHLAAVLGIFAVAFAVRWWLRCGLILGDDGQEFGLLQQVLASGPDFRDQLQVRFGGWIFNWLAAWLLGVSETTVLLPTMVLSSSFGVLAYVLFVRWGYGLPRAVAGGMLVATAPFEVVLGTLRANDLYLAGALGVGFVLLVLLEDRPIAQGVAVAVALWFGFYVKLWAVYALPALGIYALAGRRWRAATAFVATSLVLHAALLLYWKASLGTYVPFISDHAANYPVKLKDLGYEWARYPRMILWGSEFGTTLFGVVPWGLALLLGVQLVRRKLDGVDLMLFGYWGSFLLLLEFFTAGFSLDAYYTVPRIFRYLAPISFPMALHAAKLVLDVSRSWRPAWTSATVAVLLAAHLLGDLDATLPGRIHRKILFTVVHEIERMAPPRVVSEITLGFWLRSLYLDPDVVETEVTTPDGIYVATECERWIRESEAQWPTGTLLITGLGNYVHYGAHSQGLRLGWFDRPLDDRWELAGEYDVVSYLPRPERARLWRLVRGASGDVMPERADPPPPGELASIDRFKTGMAEFEAGNYRAARAHFRVLMDADVPESEDANFFYAVSFFRQENWARTRHEFKHLLGRFPSGRWAASAHWHLAICDVRRGRIRRARIGFRYVMRRFPSDPSTVEGARNELRRLGRQHDGVLIRLWDRVAGR